MFNNLGVVGTLSLLVSLSHSAKIEVLENRKITKYEPFDLRADGGTIFQAGPDTNGQDEFRYTVKVTAETDDETNQRWGLVQDLLHSTRLSTYSNNGGSINGRPGAEPPVLDAQNDPATLPFFDSSAVGDMGGIGSSVTLTITDGPTHDYATNIIDGNNERQPLDKLEVEEEFLITLIRGQPSPTQGGTNAKQCKWSYAYTVDSSNTLTLTSATTCDDAPGDVVDNGPTANEGAHRVYDPPERETANEPRFTQ